MSENEPYKIYWNEWKCAQKCVLIVKKNKANKFPNDMDGCFGSMLLQEQLASLLFSFGPSYCHQAFDFR